MENTKRFWEEQERILKHELRYNKKLSASQRKHMEGVIADIDKQNSALKKEKPSTTNRKTA